MYIKVWVVWDKSKLIQVYFFLECVYMYRY